MDAKMLAIIGQVMTDVHDFLLALECNENDPHDDQNEVVTSESPAQDIIVSFYHNAAIGSKLVRDIQVELDRRTV
jgi:hypothetical protein